MLYIAGPGHGAPATLANSWLEGHYSEIYPDRSRDEVGMLRFFRHFLSRRPWQPLHAGDAGLDPRRRRAGYSLSHGYGAAFDNPDLIVTVMVGDGEAETGR